MRTSSSFGAYRGGDCCRETLPTGHLLWRRRPLLVTRGSANACFHALKRTTCVVRATGSLWRVAPFVRIVAATDATLANCQIAGQLLWCTFSGTLPFVSWLHGHCFSPSDSWLLTDQLLLKDYHQPKRRSFRHFGVWRDDSVSLGSGFDSKFKKEWMSAATRLCKFHKSRRAINTMCWLVQFLCVFATFDLPGRGGLVLFPRGQGFRPAAGRHCSI